VTLKVGGQDAGFDDILEVLRETRPTWREAALIDAEAKLAQINILSLADLVSALEGPLNTRLRQAGLKAFKTETLCDLRRVAKAKLSSESGHIPRVDPCITKDARSKPDVVGVDAGRGDAATIWISLDRELPSVEGVMNQLDLDVDYDADWSQTVSPERPEKTGNLGSDSESCTREGLLNQLDLDENYDADWCCHIEERPDNATVRQLGLEAHYRRGKASHHPAIEAKAASRPSEVVSFADWLAGLEAGLEAEQAEPEPKAEQTEPEPKANVHSHATVSDSSLDSQSEPIPALDDLLRALDEEELSDVWKS